jgi:sugar phosphate isomerase/epimerase
MNILYFCPLWGSDQLEFSLFCDRVAEAGYDGVELSLPLNNDAEIRLILHTLEERNLTLIGQHFETINPDIDAHIAEYRSRLEWQAASKPLFINSQTGRDWFSMEDNQRIIETAAQVAQETGVKIVHETHRGKFPFSAAATRQFLAADPELRITADFSHWCTVSESLLEDQHDSVMQAIERTDHLHARVGHQEGPQVSDPRAPEWQDALNAHLSWWDLIVERHTAEGTQLTVTAEFGPYSYMPSLPYTMQPVANQWEINVFMMNLLKARYTT